MNKAEDRLDIVHKIIAALGTDIHELLKTNKVLCENFMSFVFSNQLYGTDTAPMNVYLDIWHVLKDTPARDIWTTVL